ncbi:tRNA pseudouridine(55) synthase TruB [Magnetofaba australis]|uniref:tRNA pseudouridine synthase B n=1 Tax=Magnetofaba australis IT-1 TaxID=1434232 RepID=A0A1Y2JZM0_9PROT|nr:tRNA pseudouridine(55) synthase TruB [Magnetofaba australis]OSM00357.1 putative tRNA pseudouridine synthase B [Magnetofaba australis IT-1]
MGRANKRGRPLHGWLAIHKAPGLTATGVVNRVKRILNAQKAGHGGTLDPFAEGLLPVALGEATKTLGLVLEGDKAYRCTLALGAETDSGDNTGVVIEHSDKRPDEAALKAILPEFIGEIEQVPPAHSAIRIDGERAYKKAHRGETVEMPARSVTIHSIELVEFTGNAAVINVECGKGTYMRALARDMGRRLGCFAHLTALLRTRTFGFSLDEAVTLDQLQALVDDQAAAGDAASFDFLLPVDRVLDDIPALRLTGDAWRRISNGQTIWLDDVNAPDGAVRLLDPEGRFGAVGELGERDPQGRRKLVSKRRFNLFD